MNTKKTSFILLGLLSLQSFTTNTSTNQTGYKKQKLEQHIEQLEHDLELWTIRDKAWRRIRNVSGGLTLMSIIIRIISGVIFSKAEGHPMKSSRRKQMALVALLGAVTSYSISIFSFPTFCISFILRIFSSYTLDEIREKLQNYENNRQHYIIK